jgi:hypothetical protein
MATRSTKGSSPPEMRKIRAMLNEDIPRTVNKANAFQSSGAFIVNESKPASKVGKHNVVIHFKKECKEFDEWLGRPCRVTEAEKVKRESKPRKVADWCDF